MTDRPASDAARRMAHARHILIVQEAMGWIFRGDLPRARSALAKLPVSALVEVSAAAAALSTLADETASGQHQPDERTT